MAPMSRSTSVPSAPPAGLEPDARTSTPLLAIEDLHKSYADKKVLDGLNLAISANELVCLVGPSGAGKTTLLRCLAGLQPTTSGAVKFDGTAISEPPPGLAVVFQDYSRSLLPWKRVSDNIALPLQSSGWGKKERDARVAEMLDAVGLSGQGHLFPRQLSGGMQQRVAIARAIATQPRLLLMDEPFASLDAQTRQDLEDLVLRVRDEFNITVVFVTHDIDEAVYLADRVAVLTKVPARLREVVTVDLPRPRDPLSTKADPRFSSLRTKVLALVRGLDPELPADTPIPEHERDLDTHE